ncbi:MAG: hypothetical protein HYU78_06155 [Rhodocyclales bacterium]|nr:hypothetical protein [Rhodocyclales bacterium]
MPRTLLFALSLVCTLLVAACGSPPSIRESSLLTANFEKARRLHFVYRQVELKTTSSYSYGRGAYIADTGFSQFGALLANQAAQAFAEKKVAVASAQVIDESATFPPQGVMGADNTPLPVLLVAPVSGSSQGTKQATSISHVFSVRLLDPRTKRLIWKASIDTRTWSGQDFVMKHAAKTLYDEAYAAKFLGAVAEKMADDGVI